MAFSRASVQSTFPAVASSWLTMNLSGIAAFFNRALHEARARFGHVSEQRLHVSCSKQNVFVFFLLCFGRQGCKQFRLGCKAFAKARLAAPLGCLPASRACSSRCIASMLCTLHLAMAEVSLCRLAAGAALAWLAAACMPASTCSCGAVIVHGLEQERQIKHTQKLL